MAAESSLNFNVKKYLQYLFKCTLIVIFALHVNPADPDILHSVITVGEARCGQRGGRSSRKSLVSANMSLVEAQDGFHDQEQLFAFSGVDMSFAIQSRDRYSLLAVTSCLCNAKCFIHNILMRLR